jgi:dihydrofolate reductase
VAGVSQRGPACDYRCRHGAFRHVDDAGSVDELHIIVAPVILGRGNRLFEDFTKSLDLENRGVRQSPWATFMEFAVRR